MRGTLRTLVQPLLWKGYRWYFSRKRTYHHDGLRLTILPSVFHPGLFLTTHTFLQFLQKMPLAGKKLLELGAGSGLIALWCARAGARVTASDINPAAVKGLAENAVANNLQVQVLHSDLFDDFAPGPFDVICINPPFYPKKPQNDQEMAFFCGENFEYFEKLFRQLPGFVHAESGLYLILTDDCDTAQISHMAIAARWSMQEVARHRRRGEWHFIYQMKGNFPEE